MFARPPTAWASGPTEGSPVEHGPRDWIGARLPRSRAADGYVVRLTQRSVPVDVNIIEAGPGGPGDRRRPESGACTASSSAQRQHRQLWRGHYERLDLHTPRGCPACPACRSEGDGSLGRRRRRRALPRAVCRPPRLDVRLGTGVRRLDRSPDGRLDADARGRDDPDGPLRRRRDGLQPHAARPDVPGLQGYSGEIVLAGTSATARSTPARTSSSSAAATPAPTSPSTWPTTVRRGCASRCARCRTSCAATPGRTGPVHRHRRPPAARRLRRRRGGRGRTAPDAEPQRQGLPRPTPGC